MDILTLNLLCLTIFFTVAQASEYANFCHQNRCLSCIGRYCTVTCRGQSCSDCPKGECCNGANCNICRGEKCCSSTECNTCITSCLRENECKRTPTCHYDCFQKCIPDAENHNENNKTQVHNFNVRNNNYIPVNVTTIINITNAISNNNSVIHPIIINSTNINNYARNHTYIVPDVENVPKNQNQNCCTVVQPEFCQKFQEHDELLCSTKKHKECSDAICIAEHVHIVTDLNRNLSCLQLAHSSQPLCGNYALENCDNCYKCSDIDDMDCSQNENCSQKCRASLIPEGFYNLPYRKDEA